MCWSSQVVEEDRPADTHFVAQQGCVGPLDLERGVVADVLTRVGLTGVDEEPRGIRVAVGRSIQQRTLC